MPTPPQLTPEQRRAAGEKAVRVRAVRAALRNDLTAGRCDLAAAFGLAAGDDEAADAVGAMRVRVLLESLPGVGDRIADHTMTDLAIPVGRRVRGLGASQRAALIARLGGPVPGR